MGITQIENQSTHEPIAKSQSLMAGFMVEAVGVERKRRVENTQVIDFARRLKLKKREKLRFSHT
jgi:hypothetical protein